MARTAKKKTTKKTVAKKTKTKSSNGLRFNDDTKIKVVAKNSYKEDSVAGGYLATAKKCNTVGDFKKKYPKEEKRARAYLRWLFNHGDVVTVAAA